MKCVMYFNSINDIGGVESFIYYLSKKYEFEFYYKKGATSQIKRFAKNIKVRKYKGQKIVCDKFFVNYNPDIIDNVEAKEYIMMIHCDYNAVLFKPFVHPKFTKYIGVSKYVCDVFTKLTGIEAEVCYNPLYIDKVKPKKYKEITLLSATRLTSEKGGWRIDKLSEMLDKSGINYKWYIYTNKPKKINFKSKNIILKQPKLDLSQEMANATWVVQLSDAEAYCYTAVESLYLGTPLILTDLPVYKELGIKDNAIYTDLLLSKIDIDKIKTPPIVDYTLPKDNWNKYLPTTKTYNKDEKVKVKVLKWGLTDTYENKRYKRYEEYYTTQERASYLEALDYVEIME